MRKTILITGVSRGLGSALTEEFIRQGHTVVGCGRDRSHIDGMQLKFGTPHYFDSVDVTDEAQVEAWARRVMDTVGVPDLLLNNAGLINRNAPLWQVPAIEFNAVIDVNIKGVANVIRHIVPAMIARGNGVIVNFSSGWGRGTSPEVAPYCASKWAIEGLTKALAQELPKGMAAIPLSPGIINTEMLRSCFENEATQYPLPAEWAKSAVPYLLELGPDQTGLSLTVDDH